MIGAGVTAGPNVRQNFYKNTHIFFGQAEESRNYITRCGCFRAINKQYNNNYGRIHGVFLWVRACVSVSHKCQTPRRLQHPVTQYSRSKYACFILCTRKEAVLLCPAAPLGLYSSLFTPSQYFKGSRTDIFCAVKLPAIFQHLVKFPVSIRAFFCHSGHTISSTILNPATGPDTVKANNITFLFTAHFAISSAACFFNNYH